MLSVSVPSTCLSVHCILSSHDLNAKERRVRIVLSVILSIMITIARPRTYRCKMMRRIWKEKVRLAWGLHIEWLLQPTRVLEHLGSSSITLANLVRTSPHQARNSVYLTCNLRHEMDWNGVQSCQDWFWGTLVIPMHCIGTKSGALRVNCLA